MGRDELQALSTEALEIRIAALNEQLESDELRLESPAKQLYRSFKVLRSTGLLFGGFIVGMAEPLTGIALILVGFGVWDTIDTVADDAENDNAFRQKKARISAIATELGIAEAILKDREA